MAITRVQKSLVASGSNTTTVVATYPSQPTAGNLLVITLSFNANAAVTSVSGSGVVWTRAVTNNGVSGFTTEIWYGNNTTGTGAKTVTVTFPAMSTSGLIAMEYSGMPVSSSADVTGGTSNVANVTTYAGPTISTSVASLLVASMVLNSSTTFATGPTNGFADLGKIATVGVAGADFINAAISGSWSTDWTGTARGYESVIAAFYSGSGSPIVLPKTYTNAAWINFV